MVVSIVIQWIIGLFLLTIIITGLYVLLIENNNNTDNTIPNEAPSGEPLDEGTREKGEPGSYCIYTYTEDNQKCLFKNFIAWPGGGMYHEFFSRVYSFDDMRNVTLPAGFELRTTFATLKFTYDTSIYPSKDDAFKAIFPVVEQQYGKGNRMFINNIAAAQNYLASNPDTQEEGKAFMFFDAYDFYYNYIEGFEKTYPMQNNGSFEYILSNSDVVGGCKEGDECLKYSLNISN